MSSPNDSARIQAILASGIKIPPIPAVLMEVQSLLRDPDVGGAEIARVIRQDGALSGALFRVVGSPVFGLRTRVDSLEHAVAILGIPPTLATLRGLALRQAFSDPASQAALEVLWQRSSQIALIAMALARKLRKRGLAPDQAYTLGMFHDCGLALLTKRFPAYAQALSLPGWPDIHALDQAHDTDHTLVGEQVARNWLLPEGIALAIRHHHNPSDTVPEACLLPVTVLNLACQIHAQATGAQDPGWTAAWKTLAMSRLELDEADLMDLEMDVRVELAGAG
jgi:HD-like signal output (HDOD) protein